MRKIAFLLLSFSITCLVIVLMSCDIGLDLSAAEILSVEDFSLNGTSLSLTLPNATMIYSFKDKVNVSAKATWQISTDNLGQNVIPTKTVSLTPGDNTFYILVTSGNGESASLYTVTIRRRPIYTVSFETNGGSIVPAQQVEEDSLITPPTTTRVGYTLVKWDYDFSQPVKNDIIISADWAIIDYPITYILSDGTNNSNNPESYTIEDNIILSNPTWCGDFLGWYDESGTEITNLSGCYGELTLTARWGDCYLTINDSGAITGVSDYFKQNVASLEIPSSLYGVRITSIESSVFADCTKLNTITIPESVMGIGESAFNNCNELHSVTWNATNCTYAGSNNSPIFSGCSNLTNVIIGSNVEAIPRFAFTKCAGVTEISISDSVIIIGDYAFSDCTGLTSIAIPDSVISIGVSAFSGCTELSSVTIPDSVTSIGNHMFSGCSGLTTITIPNSVTCIGDWAFFDCSRLTSITIPDSVTSIGREAFRDCSGLKTIAIPGSISSIGMGLFYGCTGLTTIAIPDNVKDIGDFAFNRCTGLTFISIPDSVMSIGECAFSYCSGLTSITIPDSVMSLGYYEFSDCIGLTSVNIGNGIMSIVYGAFSGCTGLITITIPGSVTSIEDCAFSNCTGLTSLSFTGTMGQWNQITKDSNWNQGTGAYTIHCLDGDITK